MLQSCTRKAGPYPVRRQEAAQQLPHGDVFYLKLRELVAIQPVSPFAHSGRQGQHGHLHHLVAAREPVDEPQGIAIHQVFGIVGHDDVVPAAGLPFEAHHASIHPVQAIAFGSRAIMRTHYHAHAWIAPRNCFHGPLCLRIVGIYAGENLERRIPDGREIMLQHLADDPMLAPQRHQNRDALFRSPPQFSLTRPRESAAAAECESKRNKKIVEPADENPHGQRDEAHYHDRRELHGLVSFPAAAKPLNCFSRRG